MIVTIMSNSVVRSRLYDRHSHEPQRGKMAARWSHPDFKIVTLMSNSVAARLEKPAFMKAFNSLSEKFCAAQIVTLMSDNVAARLVNPDFRKAFDSLSVKFS